MYKNGIDRDSYLQSLLTELRNLTTDTEWVEFKENYKDYEELGEYIAALANSAALSGKIYAYLVWGIHDQTHEIVGTDFKYRCVKKGNEELRIGSYKKRLKDYPEKERKLWRLFDKTPFEHQIALNNLNSDQILTCLDYPAYFDLTAQNLPSNKNGILQQLQAEKMIRKNQAGKWDIYNLGAILFAKDLAYKRHFTNGRNF